METVPCSYDKGQKLADTNNTGEPPLRRLSSARPMELRRDKLGSAWATSETNSMGTNTFSRTVDWRICPETDPVALRCRRKFQYLTSYAWQHGKRIPGIAMFGIFVTATFRPL